MSPDRAQADVAAVVLAAGLSRRMGQPKALLLLDGKPLIHRVVCGVWDAGSIAPIVVVTGHLGDAVAAAVECPAARFVHNPDPDAGMLLSVQIGLRAVPLSARGVMIVLGDQPLIAPRTIRLLIDAFTEHPAAALVVPSYQAKRGHPILINSACIPEILSLGAGEALKTFVDRRAGERVEVAVDDTMILVDIDTPEDFALARERFAAVNTQTMGGPKTLTPALSRSTGEGAKKAQ